jgi:copper homeostasis protein
MTLVEIALDDVAGGRIAQESGAGRLELCSSLAENGGTTPSFGFVREVVDRVQGIPLMVLVRPRGGDFVYARDELQVMRRDIEGLRELAPGIGFVFGALTSSGEIDVAATRDLVGACAGAPVSFHKAFDSTRDLPAALETLLGLGVDRVLTSGGRRTALDGVDVIRSLVAQAAGRVTIVAGGSIRAENVAAVVAGSGVTEVHLRAPRHRPSASDWSNPEQGYDIADVMATDGQSVRAVLAALDGTAA